MKTIDEHGTIVYFNIPHDAVVSVSEDNIVIDLPSGETHSVGSIARTTVSMQSFMRFARASSKQHRSPSCLYLQDDEFALLQKEVEQHFAKHPSWTHLMEEV
jgi:hypothetical protein